MAVTKTLLKAGSSWREPVGRMMAHVNDELCEHTDSGMFVSPLYAHFPLRVSEQELRPAHVLKDDRDPAIEKKARGLVRDVQPFCGEREQRNDIAVMALRWPGLAQ